MEKFTACVFFEISMSLYVLTSFLALFLFKRYKLCNIISNSICIIASLFGLFASVMQIFSEKEKIIIEFYKTNIPLISLNIVIDKLSAFFILGLSILVLSVSIYSIGYISHYYGKRNIGFFYFLYSTFILTIIFVMTAKNMVIFLIAWELMSVVSYFLVVFESDKKANRKAGLLYIIMTHLGTAFLTIAFMIIFSYTKSFDIYSSSSSIPLFMKNVIFVFFLIGFSTKAGIIPLHIWLPYAHPAAPSNISALMSGIMVKTAIYGIIRFILSFLKVQQTWWGIMILCIGVVSAVLGVAYALMEHDIKRLLAFHTIENIGIIMIGLGVSFIGFSQNNSVLGGLALIAALFHTFNHTLFKGGLFLGAGSIQYSTHTKDIEKLGGLIKKMPVTAILMLGFSLAISAIVPFNGFVSEWLTYQSLFMNILPGKSGINIVSILSIAALALSGALAAACFVKLFGISFLGLPRSKHASNAKEAPLTMNIGMGILMAFCIIAGIIPKIFLKAINGVAISLGGTSMLETFKGKSLLVYYPLSVSKNSISTFDILIILAVVIFFILLVTRIFGGKYLERKYGTWDCGFEQLNSRMQYSATGFSKPIRIVLKILYNPRREVEIEEGVSHYFPTKIKYKVSTEPIFEKYFYKPLFKIIKNNSRKIKFAIQTGSVHMYLIYIFITILVLMLYNRLT